MWDVAGIPEWKTAEDVASGIKMWQDDLAKLPCHPAAAEMKDLFATLDKEPDSFRFGQGVVSAMCHQMLLRDLANPSEQDKIQAISDFQEMEKFAKKFLLLSAKKQRPPQMPQVEKLIKDLKARAAAPTGS